MIPTTHTCQEIEALPSVSMGDAEFGQSSYCVKPGDRSLRLDVASAYRRVAGTKRSTSAACCRITASATQLSCLAR